VLSLHSSRRLARDGAMDDEEHDDLTFSKTFRESEETLLLPAKDADFRTFLCDSGAASEIIRLLVGLAESPSPPEDPVGFLRAKFDSEGLPEMVAGRKREDIPALLAENQALQAATAELSASLAETVGKVEAAEAEAFAPLIASLLEGGAFASDTEGALYVGKLYAAVSARFPAPPEDAEEAAPPFPWTAEDAAAPSGTVTPDGLTAFAKGAFGFGAPLLDAHAGLSLTLLVSAAAPAEQECEVDEANARGLYAACCLLIDYTEEAKTALEQPPAEE